MASFIYYEPNSMPLNSNGQPMPGATLKFFYSGTLNPAPVYADSELTQEFPSTNLIADAMGRFPVIYLDATIAYRRQLFDQYNQIQKDVDPLNTANSGVEYGAVKQLITSRASSAVLLPDPELSIALPGGSYSFNTSVKYNQSGGGLQFLIKGNVGITNIIVVATGNSGDNTSQTQSSLSTSSPFTWDSGNGSASTYILVMSGSFVIAQAQTVSVWWAQAQSNSLATSLTVPSSLTIQEIPTQ